MRNEGDGLTVLNVSNANSSYVGRCRTAFSHGFVVGDSDWDAPCATSRRASHEAKNLGVTVVEVKDTSRAK